MREILSVNPKSYASRAHFAALLIVWAHHFSIAAISFFRLDNISTYRERTRASACNLVKLYNNQVTKRRNSDYSGIYLEVVAKKANAKVTRLTRRGAHIDNIFLAAALLVGNPSAIRSKKDPPPHLVQTGKVTRLTLGFA